MLITIDIPQENLEAFRTMCEQNNIQIQQFEQSGPAGGNPRFHLLIDDGKSFAALGRFYFGG